MKKLILAAIAASSLAAGGAFAQAAGAHMDNADPAYGPTQIYGNSGWTPDRAYSSPGQPSYGGYYYGLPQILSDGRYHRRPYVAPYERTRRDRDGDGIRNNRDRHPDDPRYR